MNLLHNCRRGASRLFIYTRYLERVEREEQISSWWLFCNSHNELWICHPSCGKKKRQKKKVYISSSWRTESLLTEERMFIWNPQSDLKWKTAEKWMSPSRGSLFYMSESSVPAHHMVLLSPKEQGIYVHVPHTQTNKCIMFYVHLMH